MKIELSNEQFRDLFMSKIAYSYMLAAIEAYEEDEEPMTAYDRKEFLSIYADKFDCADMIEFDGGELLVKEEVVEGIATELLNEYCSVALPVTLSVAMAMRDMNNVIPNFGEGDRLLTKKEQEKSTYYVEKYLREFSEHWLDRMQIVK